MSLSPLRFLFSTLSAAELQQFLAYSSSAEDSDISTQVETMLLNLADGEEGEGDHESEEKTEEEEHLNAVEFQ